MEIKRAFPGICAMLAGIVGAGRAFIAYYKAIRAFKQKKTKWVSYISEHSPLSKRDVRRILNVTNAHSEIYKHDPKTLNSLVLELLFVGWSVDAIIEHTAYLEYLVEVELEGKRNKKLIMEEEKDGKTGS